LTRYSDNLWDRSHNPLEATDAIEKEYPDYEICHYF
jgi:hypothetical protein